MSSIGILGGMGPFATLIFFQKVLELLKCNHDRDYPHLIIDSNTQIPSRTRHILYGEESPVNGMLESILALVKLGANEIYIPCNSACYFLPELSSRVNIKIYNTIEITSSALSQTKSTNVMVLGGYITREKDTYQMYIERYANYIKSNIKINKYIDELIYAIKSQNSGSKISNLANIIIKIIPKNVDTIILGCTELCRAFDNISINKTVIDSNYELSAQLARSFKDGK